jgi:hypothetical protein
MVWPWSSSSDGADDASNHDPLKKLDPSLKDFLNQESSKHDRPLSRPQAPPSNDSAPTTYRAQAGLTRPDPNHEHENESVVPAQSLFPDGRYAHLWKDYRPQVEIEGAVKSDQDRIADLVATYKDRKAAVARASLENCVEYQLVERDCLTNGSLLKKMNMCREEGRAFSRCYTMQSRFLSALGYLSTQQSEEEAERVQMHADKLYHEMLERERLQKEAEEQGREVPEMPPLIAPDRIVAELGEDSAFARARRAAQERGLAMNFSNLPPAKQEEVKKRTEGLSPAEKELELQLIAAETRSRMEYAERLGERMQEEKQHRDERRERGKETVGDTLRRLWGY